MKLSENAQKKHLRILNEELENYFANTIIPQLFVDADLILRKFTPPAMKHFSLTDADINRDIKEVQNNIRYLTLVDNINEVIATGEILEKEIQTTDERWFQMNILPYIIRKENRTNGVIITFVDITSRIADLKKLEKLNAEYHTLVYALSHDIKQPLSTILLLSDGLADAYDNRNTKQFTKWIKSLRRTSEAMVSLVQGFTNHEISGTEISTGKEIINIENIYKDVIFSFKDEIYNNNIHISTNFKTSEIKFPKNNLRSIVYNLLSNAIKYKHPDRPLKIKITTLKSNNYVVLCVQDNGVGIAEQHQEKIFKKFKRLKNSTSGGTGMGLYILKRMMENHGGKVEVQSTLGKGSIFKVYFKSGY